MKPRAISTVRSQTGFAAAQSRPAAAAAHSGAGAARGMPLFLQCALQAGASPRGGAAAGSAAGGGAIAVGAPDSPFEREAESVAATVNSPAPAAPRSVSTVAGGGASATGASLSSNAGSPLRADQQEFFGTRLGHDFAGVRLHHDAESHQLNEALSARAFTHGREIFFRQGEYQPEAAQGRALLAHELVHVAQQGGGAGGGIIQRAPQPGPMATSLVAGEKVDDQAGDADQLSQKFAAVCQNFLLVIATAATPTTQSDFATKLEETVAGETADLSDPDTESIKSNAAEVAKLTQDIPGKATKLSIPDAFYRLTSLRKTPSATVGVLAYTMSRKLGYLFASGLEGMTPTPVGADPTAAAPTPSAATTQMALEQINHELARAAAALSDERLSVQIELEATLALLIDRRRAFGGASNQSLRKQFGAEIGNFSRQALLLNHLLQEMDASGVVSPSDPTELDSLLTARAREIDGLADKAESEGFALQGLDDNLSALTEQKVALENAQFPELLENQSNFNAQRHGTELRPEEAFPEILDQTENEMQRNLDERLRTQRDDVARARAAVIPSSPRYTLEEFSQVFRRWAAFFSVEQEIQDPILKMNMEMLGQPYRLFGSSALGAHPSFLAKFAMVEGAIARHFLLELVVRQLDRHVPVVSSMKLDLASTVLGKQSRHETVEGSAVGLNYQFGQLYDGPSGTLNTEGEQQNRATRSQTNREATARAFSKTTDAVIPPPEPGMLQLIKSDPNPERTVAKQEGLAPDASLPLAGLRRVEAKEGWSKLVNIYEPMSVITGNPMVVEREQKTVPTEVVDYLLAAEQHRATLAKPHQPKYNGQVIGDAAVRGQGLEETGANNAARFLQGEVAPPASDDAKQLAATRSSAMSGMRGYGVDPGDPKADLAAALIRDLEKYFTAYFATEDMQTTTNRVATVLVIAATQYGAAEKAANIVKPGRIAHTVATGLVIHKVIKFISSLGDFGKVLGKGIGAYFSVNGVNDLAAIQGLISFFMLAAEADDFSKARVRSKIVANFLSDLEELTDSLVTSAATKAVDHLADRMKNPPQTPREMADFAKPMMDNPKSRAALLEGVDAQIKEIEGRRDFDRLQPSDEYRQMVAFREQLQAKEKGTRPRANIDADLPLRRDRTEEEATNRALSRRTDAQRTELREALGPHKDLPLIENPYLGNGVRIHYDQGLLRMEVGPDAKPDHVRAHQHTVTQLKRYQGPMGKVRVLIDRVVAKLTGQQYDEVGSMRREAKMEIEKLTQMLGDLRGREASVNERAARLTADTKLAETKATQAEITRDIEGLEKQLARYETVLNTTSSGAGRGYIASGDTTGKAIAERLHEAETASRAQGDAQKKAKADLDALHEPARDARTKKQKAKDKVAEAKELETAFRDDPKALAEAKAMRDKASEELKQAEKELKNIENNVAAQRKTFETADRKYYEAREKEVGVAKEKLELELDGLYRERVEAFQKQRAAEADRKAVETPLLEATAAMNRVLDAHKQPPAIPTGLPKDQQLAAYNAALAARRQVEQPHRDRVAQLKGAYDKANQRAADAQAKRNEATETINKRRADFEARQAEAFGIPRTEYESLRSRTPNTARQDAVKDAKVDAIYGTPIKDTPHADHIVPMFEIVRMPGFARLTDKQRMDILNDPKNFWALDGRVNSSKGHRSLREWKGHSDIDTFKPIPDAKMKQLIAAEDTAREHIRDRINALAPPLTPDGS